jgi:hypothetical protein
MGTVNKAISGTYRDEQCSEMYGARNGKGRADVLGEVLGDE